MDNNAAKSLGEWGEAAAARYLEARGLRVEDRHYYQKWGEIDLICRARDTWVFVEVKTRRRRSAFPIVETVTARKRERIIRAAMSYMKWKRLEGCHLRFDIVLIEAGEIEWIPNAFDGRSDYTY